MTHREAIKEWLGKIKLENVRVVDWGRGTKPAIKYVIAGKNVDYFGIDELDHVEADLVVDMTLAVDLGERYDVAFCMEVLEHVESPSAVLDNIYENLEPGGRLYMSVPFMFPIHHTKDYWRFTDQGVRLLLSQSKFQCDEIIPTVGQEGWLIKAHKPII